MRNGNGAGGAIPRRNETAFLKELAELTRLVEDRLKGLLAVRDVPEHRIYESMAYSVAAGGKRIRPVLFLAVGDMLGGKIDEMLPYACAMELIHTYSLIHDDLPAMDNDDFRRGLPTNHRAYGEAMAILAGDALLNRAFELMLETAMKQGADDAGKLSRGIQAAHCMAEASGVSGMIGGQVMDMEAEGRNLDMHLLDRMHRLKTGALIRACAVSPAILCGADDATVEALAGYAENLGLAFQIRDDLLDVESTDEVLGKPVGSDERNGKSTFVTLLGLEGARLALASAGADALDALGPFGEKAAFLAELAEFIATRRH